MNFMERWYHRLQKAEREDKLVWRTSHISPDISYEANLKA
jgi:maltooligosyltrehalose synthase